MGHCASKSWYDGAIDRFRAPDSDAVVSVCNLLFL